MSNNKAQEIRTQVEFYFGDENYPTGKNPRLSIADPVDKFLKKQARRDGFVPLSVVANFPKIKALTEDMNELVEAIRPSEKLILHADGARVKRKDPLPPKTKQHKPKGNLVKKYTGQSLEGQHSIRLDGNLDPKFIESILHQVVHITNLDLRKNHIGASGGLLLARALMDPECKLRTMFLYNCEIGDEGVKHISTALETNKSLVKLNLCDNGFTGIAGSHIAAALRKNTTLQKLDLNNNQFGNEGASLISKAFITNSTIKTFSLWNTGISDDVAYLWLEILGSNTTLEKLNLEGNKIKESLLDEIDNKMRR